MRLAYFSPFNPVISGVSDYSEELVPYLAAYADLTLVVDGYTPTNAALTGRFPVIQDRDADAAQFDLALYHLGNSPAHAYIYKRALAEPGVIVLHDWVLHHLVAWMTLERGDRAGYIDAMGEAYGEAGRQLAAHPASELQGMYRFDYPLSEPVLTKARGVIVHSRYVSELVTRAAPQVPVAQIPHEVPDTPVHSRDAARAQLKLPADALLVGSFGNLGPIKRTTVLLDAFRQVRQNLPKARLVFVGAGAEDIDLNGLLAMYGLGDAVHVTGHVPFELFNTYMAAMDVCVNLRYPTAGETSGAVLRMMAQAKPVVVSRVGWFAELPGDAAAKIDVDETETELVRVTMERLLNDAPLRAAMGAHARQYIVEQCGVEDAARAYADFLQAVVEGRAQSTSYFKVGAPGKEPTFAVAGGARAAREDAHGDEPPAANRGAEGDWRTDIANACAGLGFSESDAVLEQVARAMVELGLGESQDN